MKSELVFRLQHPGYMDPDDPDLETQSDERIWFRQSRAMFLKAKNSLPEADQPKLQNITDGIFTFALNILDETNYSDNEVESPSQIELKYHHMVQPEVTAIL